MPPLRVKCPRGSVRVGCECFGSLATVDLSARSTNFPFATTPGEVRAPSPGSRRACRGATGTSRRGSPNGPRSRRRNWTSPRRAGNGCFRRKGLWGPRHPRHTVPPSPRTTLRRSRTCQRGPTGSAFSAPPAASAIRWSIRARPPTPHCRRTFASFQLMQIAGCSSVCLKTTGSFQVAPAISPQAPLAWRPNAFPSFSASVLYPVDFTNPANCPRVTSSFPRE